MTTIKDKAVIHVKHMVCPRCITIVRQVFKNQGLIPIAIELGHVEIAEVPKSDQLVELGRQLKTHGFEILQRSESKLVSATKTYIIDKIQSEDSETRQNLSTELSSLLNMDYSTISRTFAKTEGITVEKFMLNQKVEKVKELISYEELSITEIAYRLNYSSAAHLSSQFKKVTGMSPSAFKSLQKKPRKSISDL